MIRHGARAPDHGIGNAYGVPTGNLTGAGMRQKLLWGKMNRERYINQYEFIDDDFLPSQMVVQSTDIFRTIQSGYAELLGLYPPHHSRESLSDGEENSL
jgi:hypothetical protein